MPPQAANPIVIKIEHIFESFCDTMIEDRPDREFVIPITTAYRASRNHKLDPDTGGIKSNPSTQAIDVPFPGKTPEQAWRFSVESL